MNAKKRATRGRKSKNTFTTKSGQTIKIRRNLVERLQARRAATAEHKALRLAGLPKSRVKRFIYRLHPKRLYRYWFSREGAIMALKITGIGFIAGFLTLVGLFAYFRKDLPNLRDITGKNIGGSISYYDRTGKVLLYEDYDAIKRIPVKDDQISKFMKDATVAVEDKDFFHHGGFDVRGIMRAGFNNALGKSGTQGGSTITQQLVKLNQNWTRDRSYTRKVKELILAVELERSYSKQEILGGYLNAAPYGSIDYGVEAAARDYFNKSAKDLTLDEAAFLAAIPKSPGYYSPYNTDFATSGGKEELLSRQDYILDLMEQQGMINKRQRDEAKKVDTVATVKPRKPKYDGIKAPYFVLTAKQELEDKLGAQSAKVGGWKVITTMDVAMQELAEQQVNNGIAQVRRQGGDVAALAAEDVKTGQMVALVGGPDFSNPTYGQNNYAHSLKLSPGSTIKPYEYASLIENTTNFGAGSVLYDTLGPLEGYPCTNKALPERGGNCLYNYDRRSPGPITIRYALGGSRNIPAAKALLIAGIEPTYNLVHRMMTTYKDGRPSDRGYYKCYKPGTVVDSATVADETPCSTAASIGDGAYLRLDENTHGYATFSRNGLNLPQTYILDVQDANGKSLEDLKWKPSKGDQAIKAETAYIINDILADPNASYFGPGTRGPHRYNNGQGTWKFSVKTGTTGQAKDGLMMATSTRYAVGVWVGYHNREKIMSGSMETMTQPIAIGWMKGAHASLKPEERPRPSGVQTLPAFVIRSHVGFGSVEPSPSTDLFPSWYKSKTASNTRKTIDIVSNKLATDCTPARAKKEVTETDASSFSGDKFVTGGGNTGETDDVHKCEDVKPGISLSEPDGNGDIIATVTQGTHALDSARFRGTVNFIVNGQIIQSFSVTYSGQSVTLPGGTAADGSSVSAEVIDSVLYDGQSPNSITATGSGSSSLTITAPTSGQDISNNNLPTNITATWTGGGSTFSVSLDGSPVATCQNISSTSCGITVIGTNGSAHIITVSSGSTSKSVSFTK